jgi:cobalt transporter subunit CbtB
MTTASQTRAIRVSNLTSILVVALLGVTLMYVAGHAHGNMLHNAAHDTRHSIGYPCH